MLEIVEYVQIATELGSAVFSFLFFGWFVEDRNSYEQGARKTNLNLVKPKGAKKSGDLQRYFLIILKYWYMETVYVKFNSQAV